MIFIGIDIAKDKHDIVIIDDYGEIIKEHFTIHNNIVGFKKLHTEIRSCMKSLKDTHIGMEETGIYHSNLRDYLISKEYTVYTINPLLTSYSRKASSPRLTKTDKIDCVAICRYIMNNYRSLHSYTPSLYHLNELKQLSRIYVSKSLLLSKSKVELKRLLQISFPEFTKHFNPYSKWTLKILHKYPLPSMFKGIHTNTLINSIRTMTSRLDKAILLKQIANETIGNSTPTHAFLIQSTIDDIFHYQKQLDDIKQRMEFIVKLFPKILSVPGIGIINGSTILGETGDINRFQNKHEYFAFFGLDPIIYESGNYQLKKSRISKRGSKTLRSAAFSASRIACIGMGKDNKFRTKYFQMKQRGKHHNLIICAVAKNIVHSIYTILKYDVYYDDTK